MWMEDYAPMNNEYPTVVLSPLYSILTICMRMSTVVSSTNICSISSLSICIARANSGLTAANTNLQYLIKMKFLKKK